MKKNVAVFLVVLASIYLSYAQKVKFMVHWTEQAQWAGYYMAQKCGFYEQEGLDVDIIHPMVNSSKSNMDNLLCGDVQIITQQLISSIKLASEGVPLVNVLQTSKKSALVCVSRTPIRFIRDLDGKKIATWSSGWFNEPFKLAELKYNIKINWIPFTYGINSFIFGAVDAILCFEYNEYKKLISATGGIDERCVVKAADLDYNFPEDGVYVTKEYYYNNKETIDKFVRASIKGWQYAREHKDETLEYVMEIVKQKNIMTNRYLQEQMLDIILSNQIDAETGKADYTPVPKEKFDFIIHEMVKYEVIKNNVSYYDFIK